MMGFLRKRYVLIALIWWLCSLAIFVEFVADHSTNHAFPSWLFLILMLLPWLVPAVLLATRGFRETSTARVFVSIYLVILVPTGLLSLASDLQSRAQSHHTSWATTWFWFNLAIEGGFLASPIVLGFSAVVACLTNFFSKNDRDIFQ